MVTSIQVVVIRSKAGKEPLSIRLKANPSTYQAAASVGFKLGENVVTSTFQVTMHTTQADFMKHTLTIKVQRQCFMVIEIWRELDYHYHS